MVAATLEMVEMVVMGMIVMLVMVNVALGAETETRCLCSRFLQWSERGMRVCVCVCA